MPHYSDGTPAKVGDIVRGVGYNKKFNVLPKLRPLSGSNPQEWSDELIGTVVAVKQGETCNLEIAYVSAAEIPETIPSWSVATYSRALLIGSGKEVKALNIEIEYGDTKAFRKIG